MPLLQALRHFNNREVAASESTPYDRMNQKALLLVNPHARRGEAVLKQASQQLQGLGIESIQESAENPQLLPEIIRNYQNQVDRVIVASGDGTVSAAIEGLLDTRLPLGILPSGTANNLARNLKIPASLPEACQIIANGRIDRIDLGWVNGKYFFNVAGLGLSSQINRRVQRAWKRRWGVLAYAATAFTVLWQSQPFTAEIHCQQQTVKVKSFQITVCNGRYYGSGLVVAEDATIDDRRLDLYSLETESSWEIMRLLPAMIQGKPDRGARILHGKEIAISTDKPCAIDTDGEITTQTPALFRVVPQAIGVFVPA